MGVLLNECEKLNGGDYPVFLGFFVQGISFVFDIVNRLSTEYNKKIITYNVMEYLTWYWKYGKIIVSYKWYYPVCKICENSLFITQFWASVYILNYVNFRIISLICNALF